MRVAMLTANLAGFERNVQPVPQVMPEGVELTQVWFTDANDPPRVTMHPRLQARILKILGWQRVPGYDVYLWVDGQFTLATPDALAWLLEQLGDADIAFFTHPSRASIHEEAEWITHRFPISNRLMQRYTGERLDEQMAVIEATPGFSDDYLCACGLGAYRNTLQVQAMTKEWWYHVSRYHNNDQLSFPFVAWQFGLKVKQIPGDVFHDPRFVWTRGPYHA